MTDDQSVLADGPVLERSVPGTGYLDLYFKENGSALDLRTEDGFVIAGADRVFYPAKLKQEGAYQLRLSSEKVANPVAARYAFDNATEASLFNEVGLPATSFRTDDWPLFYGSARLSITYTGPKDAYVVGLTYPASQHHQLHYSLDGSEPSLSSPVYPSKLNLQRDQTLKVRAFADTIPSPYLLAYRFSSHLGMDAEIIAQSLGEQQYSASGEYALLDGLSGSQAYDDGRWRGYLGDTILLEIDLGKRVSIDSISTHFLQRQGSWIYGPASVEIAISSNGKRYQTVLNARPDSEKAQKSAQILPFAVGLAGQKVRYIRLLATPISQLPAYHPGAGKAAWLFVDELIVK
ncbi:MAG: discoidin domain-containing protein [Bacteroidota bacterium]